MAASDAPLAAGAARRELERVDPASVRRGRRAALAAGPVAILVR